MWRSSVRPSLFPTGFPRGGKQNEGHQWQHLFCFIDKRKLGVQMQRLHLERSAVHHQHRPATHQANKPPISLAWKPRLVLDKHQTAITPSVDGSSSHTLWISYFNVGRWTAQGHSDFLQAGVKGQLPSVVDPSKVIGGQQVNLGRLHSLLHPLQDLPRKCKECRNHRSFLLQAEMICWILDEQMRRLRSLTKNNNVKGSRDY